MTADPNYAWSVIRIASCIAGAICTVAILVVLVMLAAPWIRAWWYSQRGGS